MSSRQIRIHPKQAEPLKWLWDPSMRNQFRFAVVAAARGFGKSWLGATVTALAAKELESLPPDVPNKNIAVICATLDQATKVYYPLLRYTLNLGAVAKVQKQPSLRFMFPNRTEITCWSADAYERLRGTGQYLIIADELSSWKVPGGSVEDAWESVIEPCILSRWAPPQAERSGAPSPGRALVISTVRGRDYFYDLTLRADKNPWWKFFKYTYRDSPLLSHEDIERAKEDSDPLRFAREYECDFGESGLTVFHSFDRSKHVSQDIPWFSKEETVHASIDFNIMLNATTFHAVRDNVAYALDEHKGSANTEDLARIIKAKFPDNPVVCYPDPTGKKRVTSSPVGSTDFTILKDAGFKVLARSSMPSVVDSVAAVNRKLLNANNEISYFIHPRCHELLQSFERTIWSETQTDRARIDKSQNMEHFTDGVRYFVEYKWPLKKSRAIVVSSDYF